MVFIVQLNELVRATTAIVFSHSLGYVNILKREDTTRVKKASSKSRRGCQVTLRCLCNHREELLVFPLPNLLHSVRVEREENKYRLRFEPGKFSIYEYLEREKNLLKVCKNTRVCMFLTSHSPLDPNPKLGAGRQ